MGRNVNIPNFPERIISLVPSQTELLFDLGLGSRVIGINKFCIHPERWHRSKIKIGGTKQLNFDKINTLNPNLIIGNQEENNKSQVRNLMKNYPVWMSDISNLEESCSMINSIGEMTNSATKSMVIVSKIRQEFSKLTPLNSSKNVLYLIWKNPYIAVGKNTHDLQELLPNTLIILVNGELFSWYGSRLLLAPAYFLKLLSKI